MAFNEVSGTRFIPSPIISSSRSLTVTLVLSVAICCRVDLRLSEAFNEALDSTTGILGILEQVY